MTDYRMDTPVPLTNPVRSESGLAANRPVVRPSGSIYYATDTGVISQVQSGVWVTIFDPADFPIAGNTVTTQAYGDAAVSGAADAYSRSDHKHGFPTMAMSYGQYTGNNTQNRAIAHGLGRTPKIIFITPESWGTAIFDLQPGVIQDAVSYRAAHTGPDSTNFYVGITGYMGESKNANGLNYYWVAIG